MHVAKARATKHTHTFTNTLHLISYNRALQNHVEVSQLHVAKARAAKIITHTLISLQIFRALQNHVEVSQLHVAKARAAKAERESARAQREAEALREEVARMHAQVSVV